MTFLTRALEGLRNRERKANLKTVPRIREEEDAATASVSTVDTADELAVPKPHFSFRTMGGAFHSTLRRCPCTLITFQEDEEEVEERKPPKGRWKSCQVPNYHRHSPARSYSVNDTSSGSDDETDVPILKRQPKKRELPDCWYFSSNHILVNRERSKRNIQPLIRCSKLDTLARQHALYMAGKDKVCFAKRIAVEGPSRRIGQNVASGTSIREIHIGMMKLSKGDKNNILDTRYRNFGMATAKGPDGRLYLCQVFKG